MLEMNNYYDIQRPEVDDKISIVVTFFKDLALEWWTSKPKVVASLTWVDFKELFIERITT